MITASGLITVMNALLIVAVGLMIGGILNLAYKLGKKMDKDVS